MSGHVFAQVVLWPPCVTGYSGFTYSTRSAHGIESLRLGHYYGFVYGPYGYLYLGIIEFDAQYTACGGELPTTGMTSDNWTARLCDLEVISAYSGHPQQGQYFDCVLDAMQDNKQDCLVDNDWLWTESAIQHLFSRIPEVGTRYTDIDITESLRNDLFGVGSGEISTGYILRTNVGLKYFKQRVVFDDRIPYIAIHVDTGGEPTKTPPPMLSTPTPTSSPTPFDPDEDLPSLGVRLTMPAHYYSPHDECRLDLTLNNSGFQRNNVVLFVVLDVYSQFFFYPDWNETVDYSANTLDLHHGVRQMSIIPQFNWPAGIGHGGPARFLSMMTDQNVSEIIGEMDDWEFSW